MMLNLLNWRQNVTHVQQPPREAVSCQWKDGQIMPNYHKITNFEPAVSVHDMWTPVETLTKTTTRGTRRNVPSHIHKRYIIYIYIFIHVKTRDFWSVLHFQWCVCLAFCSKCAILFACVLFSVQKNDCNGRGLEAPGIKGLPQKPLVCEQREEPHSCTFHWTHDDLWRDLLHILCGGSIVHCPASPEMDLHRPAQHQNWRIAKAECFPPACTVLLQMEFSGSWYGHAWLWLIQHKTTFQMVLNAAKPEYPMTHMVATLSKRVMPNYSNTM